MSTNYPVPPSQTVLLLHAPRQPYQVTHDYAVPELLHDREILVRTAVIGLNPIDWKSADFNFAIPELPYIAGRECAGEVVRLKERLTESWLGRHGKHFSPHTPERTPVDGFPETEWWSRHSAEAAYNSVMTDGPPVSLITETQNDGNTRILPGNRVLAISTDYRDLRKGAYQEYVVVWDYNTVRLPPHLSYEAGATIGVAFVAAILALGVNLGIDFGEVENGPDLLSLVRQLPPSLLAKDIRDECLSGISPSDRALPGDWIAVWGASSTSAHIAIQLARLAGLRVAAVVDTAKHGWRLAQKEGGEPWQPDLVVDSHDPERAVAVLRANLGSRLRFGFDTRGRDTATHLLKALACSQEAVPTKEKKEVVTAPKSYPSPPSTPPNGNVDVDVNIDGLSASRQSHLVGLTGLPKGAAPPGCVFHNVPIKLFHEVPAVGEALSSWLERLLASKKLVPPAVHGVEQGLEGVNTGLDRLRSGEISGGRVVVRITDSS